MTPAEAPAPPPQVLAPQVLDQSWAGWFRQHFAVFVLLFMVVFMFLFILHVSHHGADSALLQFAEGHSQTFVGALVGALTTGGIQQLVNRPKP